MKESQKITELFPVITSLITKTLEYKIFRMLLAESVLTVKELAVATNYSVREIQKALNSLIKQDLVVRTKIYNNKTPVYLLNRSKIQISQSLHE